MHEVNSVFLGLLTSHFKYVTWSIFLSIHLLHLLSLSPSFSLFLSLNSILIEFNLLFNSRTLWSLFFFDRLLAFPSLSSSLYPPPSIHPFQVFILFSISSYFHSLSHISKRERERRGKGGESKEMLREIEKLYEVSNRGRGRWTNKRRWREKGTERRKSRRGFENESIQGQTDEMGVSERGDDGRRGEGLRALRGTERREKQKVDKIEKRKGGVRRQQLSQIADISLGYIIRNVPLSTSWWLCISLFPWENQYISAEPNFQPQVVFT